MKKITLLAVLAISFASCKKNYTCECSGAGYPTVSATFKDTKSKAKTSCDNLTNTYNTGGITGYACVIK